MQSLEYPLETDLLYLVLVAVSVWGRTGGRDGDLLRGTLKTAVWMGITGFPSLDGKTMALDH